jgi:integrase
MAYIRKYKNGYRAEVEKLGIRESRTFETKRLAQEWGKRRELEIDGTPAQEIHLFHDVCGRYLRDVSSRKDGVKWEALRIGAFKEHFKNVPIDSLKQPQMAAWRDARIKEVTGGTVRREKTLLNHIFTVARLEWHYITHKPFEGVSMPPDNEVREQTWKWQQIKRVLRAPTTGKTREVVDCFHIALRSAMRLQEALAAPELFDKVRQVVDLPPELDKMKRRRVIPIGRIAAKLLNRPAFVVDPNEASTLFSDLLGCLGIEGMMFRDSRATALTLLARKVDVMRLQKISGHKDVRMLSRYYREAAEDISKLI